jgi:hypothetical protein
MKFTDLNPKIKQILKTYPKRNRVKWIHEKERIVLIYPKDFSKLESWLHQRIGGPSSIRRPLDEIGSKIWLMSDGKHTVMDICTVLDEEYREDIEPVLDRVTKFLEVLLRSNLIRLSSKKMGPKKLRVIKEK